MMKCHIAGEDNHEITFFVKDKTKYYSVIFDKDEECWECECNNLFCEHIKTAIEHRKEKMIQ